MNWMLSHETQGKKGARTSAYPPAICYANTLVRTCFAPKYPHGIKGAFTDVQVTQAVGSNTPAYRDQTLSFEPWVDDDQDRPFPLWPREHYIISKNNVKGGLIRPLHTVLLCVRQSQKSFSPEKSAVFLDVADIWLQLFVAEP